jgi:UV DNA damage repair endonuclease
MEKNRNGIIVRLSAGNNMDDKSTLSEKIADLIKSSLTHNTSYSFYIIELNEKDLQLSIESEEFIKERFVHYLEDLNLRIAFYIKSKNSVISTDSSSRKKAKLEIEKTGRLIKNIDSNRFSIPLICHIGGAKGNRKKSMIEFCKFFDSLPKSTQEKICIINDDKPSLYSVKDLLSYTYIERKIPIVFRTNSFRTNSGGLTYKESLFLASSTWAERDNPIVIYCPYDQVATISSEDLNPYNLTIDIVFDNKIPDPVVFEVEVGKNDVNIDQIIDEYKTDLKNSGS